MNKLNWDKKIMRNKQLQHETLFNQKKVGINKI